MKMFEAILRLSKLDFKKENLCFICSIIIISISPSSGNVGEKKKDHVYLFPCVWKKERKRRRIWLREDLLERKWQSLSFCTDTFHKMFFMMNEAKRNVTVLYSFSTRFL